MLDHRINLEGLRTSVVLEAREVLLPGKTLALYYT